MDSACTLFSNLNPSTFAMISSIDLFCVEQNGTEVRVLDDFQVKDGCRTPPTPSQRGNSDFNVAFLNISIIFTI